MGKEKAYAAGITAPVLTLLTWAIGQIPGLPADVQAALTTLLMSIVLWLVVYVVPNTLRLVESAVTTDTTTATAATHVSPATVTQETRQEIETQVAT